MTNLTLNLPLTRAVLASILDAVHTQSTQLTPESRSAIIEEVVRAVAFDYEGAEEVIVHRDAETGRFVTEEEAAANPATTVASTIKRL